MATISDCIINGDDVRLIKSHISAVVSILGKYGILLDEFCDAAAGKDNGSRPATEEYSGCEFVTISQLADLIFEWYHCSTEDQKTKVGFITSKLKTRKYLTYHQTVSGRAYNCGERVAEGSPGWLVVPDRCRADHSREFYTNDLRFVRDKMSQILYDLWIGKEDYFLKNLQGFKDYKSQFQKGNGR